MKLGEPLKLLTIFLVALGLSGCGSSSLEVSRSEICEAQVDETSCRESDCAWRISRKLWLEDGVCEPITDYQYFCTAREDDPYLFDEERRTCGYYRSVGDGYEILFIFDHNGSSVPGWHSCNLVEGWEYGCWNCSEHVF